MGAREHTIVYAYILICSRIHNFGGSRHMHGFKLESFQGEVTLAGKANH